MGAQLVSICLPMMAFMIVSCFWMPLCVVYIRSPSTGIFILIRLVLALAGLLACVWAFALSLATCSIMRASRPSGDDEDVDFTESSTARRVCQAVLACAGCTGAWLLALHC